MKPRERAAEQLAWWRQQVQQLRMGPGAPEYQLARAALAGAIEQLARRALHSYRKDLGDEFDDIIKDKLWGLSQVEPPSTTPNARPGQLPVHSRNGLLAMLERRDEAVAKPAAFCRTALERALISARRRRQRLVESDASAEGAAPGALSASPGTIRVELDDGGASLGGDAHEAALLSVPRAVERTLTDAVEFAAVAREIAPRLPRNHRLRRMHEDGGLPAIRTIRRWYGMAAVLGADIEARRARPRWRYERRGDTTISYPRAWQGRYYTDAGAEGFTNPDEVPADDLPTARNLFYKHLSRFRQDFGGCSAVGLHVVERAAGLPSAVLRASDGRRRLPCAWDPAEHSSLEA